MSHAIIDNRIDLGVLFNNVGTTGLIITQCIILAMLDMWVSDYIDIEACTGNLNSIYLRGETYTKDNYKEAFINVGISVEE